MKTKILKFQVELPISMEPVFRKFRLEPRWELIRFLYVREAPVISQPAPGISQSIIEGRIRRSQS